MKFNNMISRIKSRLFLFLEKKGWVHHPKEKYTFEGKGLWVTKKAFLRDGEKDDAWIYSLARHHKNILDIGCNVGQSSLLFLIGTTNKVVCVDPNPKALSKCAENMIYNNYTYQTMFVNAFVGDSDGAEIPFYTIGSGAAGSMFSEFAKTASRHHQVLMVKTNTVDTICKRLNFIPDLIKIDVEGAEQFVLRGIGENILSGSPAIFVEVHSGIKLSIVDNTEAILKWCNTNNYRAYYLKKHEELVSTSMISGRGRYHTLLLPKNIPYPKYLMSIQEGEKLLDYNK